MLFTHLLMVAPAWGKKSTFPFAVIVRLGPVTGKLS